MDLLDCSILKKMHRTRTVHDHGKKLLSRECICLCETKIAGSSSIASLISRFLSVAFHFAGDPFCTSWTKAPFLSGKLPCWWPIMNFIPLGLYLYVVWSHKHEEVSLTLCDLFANMIQPKHIASRDLNGSHWEYSYGIYGKLTAML